MAGIKGNKKVETKIEGDIHYRKCTECNEWLTVDNYYSNCKNNPYWIDSVCKNCRKQKSIKRQKNKKTEINQKKKTKENRRKRFTITL